MACSDFKAIDIEVYDVFYFMKNKTKNKSTTLREFGAPLSLDDTKLITNQASYIGDFTV